MNNPRQIELDSAPLPELVEPVGPIYRSFTRNTYSSEEKTIDVEGDLMVATKIEREWVSRYVNYAWIERHARVDEDDEMRGTNPWDHYDGWGHDLENCPDRDGDTIICCGDFVGKRVVLDASHDREFRELAIALRAKGASKQRCAEKIAQLRKERVRAIVNWYEEGCEWYQVAVSVELLGKRYCHVCGEIDDKEYAKEEILPDVVGYVADLIEKDGYIVTGRPDAAKIDAEHRNASLQYQLCRNRYLF